jgi:hemerythrin-like domain-containing protein
MARMPALLSVQSAACFATGAMLTLVAARMLPPLLAQARGAIRAERGGDPLAPLLEDHVVIMRHLDAMVESADSETLVRSQRLLRLKRRLGAHAMAEENIVYPVLQDNAATVEDSRRLFAEHAEMKTLLYKLEVTATSDARWHGYASDLRRLVERHIRQEEDVVFPHLRTVLSNGDSTTLASKIEREKALLL